MEIFIEQVLAGLSTGAIYACLGLAVVMIYQSTGHLNFAQGEMAMASTFVAWQLIQWGVPYWVAFFITVALSFMMGVICERVLMAPLRNAHALSHIAVFIGLLVILNSTAGFIWDFTVKTFPSPFGTTPVFGSHLVSAHEAGMMMITGVLLLVMFAFFRYTRLGLAMKAAAENPVSARLVGIRVGRMQALGWGLATAVGSIAGMLIAPIVFLEPNMMAGTVLYGFAGAVLGGLASPGGAVLGGLIVGVLENLSGTFIPVIGGELKLPIALLIIVAVLVVKPQGLLGRASTQRV
jgi:branched-chain amino acid transport system permease protein